MDPVVVDINLDCSVIIKWKHPHGSFHTDISNYSIYVNQVRLQKGQDVFGRETACSGSPR